MKSVELRVSILEKSVGIKESMKTIYKSKIGLDIVIYDHMKGFTITGYPNSKYTVKKFDSARDFEEFLERKNLKPRNIQFDCEYSQFFAYAETKQSAINFVKSLENYFENVQELLK